MMVNLPLSNLNKVNWLISVTCALLILIFMVSLDIDLKLALPRTLQVLVLVAIVTFFNLKLLEYYFKRKSFNSDFSSKWFYVASYLLAGVAWFVIKNSYSLISGEKWEGEAKPVLATILALLSVFILNTFIVVIHSLIILQFIRSRGEVENLQLKAKHSEVQNLLLRQQIHPHFLFNSLNTIKSLYRTDPEQGQNYLVHLASFLRATINNQHTQTTLIKNEIAFCEDYLKMQRIRFDQALDYSIEISKDTANSKFVPYFSLQPLIENALKHNELSEHSPLLIRLYESEDYLYVINNIRPKSFKDSSTGTGISSLNERYRLLGSEDVRVENKNGMFRVGIKILSK